MNGSIVFKSDLSREGQALVEQMQRINFGRIEHLPVRGGQPVWSAQSRVIRKIKFGGENAPRTESGHGNFELKRQVIDLFDQLEIIGEGYILSVEIKHGLPFAMDVEKSLRGDHAGGGVPSIPPTSPQPISGRKGELAAV
jgi:hypothetical protein